MSTKGSRDNLTLIRKDVQCSDSVSEVFSGQHEDNTEFVTSNPTQVNSIILVDFRSVG